MTPPGPDAAGTGMRAEFGTYATWTAEAIQALGLGYAVPAACRGSGTPAALTWLLRAIGAGRGDQLLDIGAGLGGPAEFARRQSGVVPVCVDPMPQACHGARDLFGLSVVQADAASIPCAANSFHHAWSLGTLCTTRDRTGWLTEWGRVLAPGARLGLLVLVSTTKPFETAEGNCFPTLVELERLWARSGFYPVRQRWSRSLAGAPDDWAAAEEAVERYIAERHGAHALYAVAHEQERAMGRLLASQQVQGLLVVVARA